MNPRIDFKKLAPDVVEAMRGLEECVSGSGLNKLLLELVYLRASQINGCAQCLDVHTKKLRAAGDSEQRLYLLSAWRESPFYSERERAALAWTEAVTQIEQSQVPDETYNFVRQNFSEKELVYLTLAVITINGLNRLHVSMRTVPGSYQVPSH